MTGARSPSSPDDGQRLVEVAPHLQDPGPVDQGLRQLPERDMTLGDQHRAGEAGPGGERGGRCRGVAGGRAYHRLGPFLGSLGDGHGHATVLERPGGVGPLDLEQDARPDPRRQPGSGKQRRPPLQQRDHRGGVGHWQVVAVLLDDPLPPGTAPLARRGRPAGHSSSPTMRMTPPIRPTVSSWASSARVSRMSPSRAEWVTKRRRASPA